MPDAPQGRRFTSEETALILRRATEGEQRLDDRRDGSLTLDEIVAAANEAGIDAAAVRRAAAVSALPTESIRSRVFGAPADVVLQATFPGGITAERVAGARDAIERAMGRRGEVEILGGTFIWREEHGIGRTQVEASAAGGAVEVSATAERKGHLLALTSGVSVAVAAALIPLGGFAGMAAVVGSLGSVLAPIGAIYLSVRAMWPAMQRREVRKLESAMLELGAVADEERTKE